VPIVGAAMPSSMLLQGTSFSDILIHKYQLSSQRQWDVASALPLK
jgi:hypothetical protein